MAGTLELDKLCKVGLPPRAMALLELPEDPLLEVEAAGAGRDHAPLFLVFEIVSRSASSLSAGAFAPRRAAAPKSGRMTFVSRLDIGAPTLVRVGL
jgi:hypothetical protein